MSTTKSVAVYQKISKICSIAIPVLYVLAVIISVAMLAITGVMLFGSGGLELNDGVEIDLASLSVASRIILAVGLSTAMLFLVRFFWLLINVAKRFKVGEVFSDDTASYAQSAAFNLLVLHIMALFIAAYGAFLTGDIKLELPDGIVSIVFAYLFAWVLKIGSQLKAENDLTV